MAVASSTSAVLNGREVIVAIVGGTMLTVALTRPRLRWVERLTEESPSSRVWAERALTCFSLVMVGYALITLDAALHRQLDSGSNALLRGAVIFLIIYAWLVHLEPFVREWRLRGGAGACFLYTFVAGAMGLIGVLLAEIAVSRSLPSDTLELSLWSGAFLVAGWVAYRLAPAFDGALNRICDRLFTSISSTKAPREENGSGE